MRGRGENSEGTCREHSHSNLQDFEFGRDTRLVEDGRRGEEASNSRSGEVVDVNRGGS